MRFILTLAAGALLALPAPAFTHTFVANPSLRTKLRIAEHWVRTQMAQNNVPGASMAIVHDQQVIWSKAFGFANLETNTPATVDTRYSICSISKLFTSMAAMRERDAGRLDLDRPISAYLPWYNVKTPRNTEAEVTPRSIMTHSSGLPREAEFRYWSDQQFPSLKDLKSKLGTQARFFEPFSYHQYSNLGMSLLGEAVAHVSRKSYHDYVREHLIQPLGMTQTTPDVPTQLWGTEMAIAYKPRVFDWTRKAYKPYRVNALAPAAGFVSTAGDMAKFASWQFRLLSRGGEELLKATTLREMHRLHWMPADGNLNLSKESFGLGFQNYQYNGKTFVGHGGGCPGYRSFFLMRRQDKLAYIVMFNVFDSDARTFAHELYDLTASDIMESLKSRAAALPDELSSYEGVYVAEGWPQDTYVASYKEDLVTVSLFATSAARAITRYRKIGPDAFRRIRSDDSLAEELRFERDPAGRPWRMWQDGDYFERRIR